MKRGSCVLSANEAGQVLDRLAGLEKVIHSEFIKQALQETGRVNRRSCVLTHEVVMWIVLAMGLLTNMPIRQVFKHARRLRPQEKTPHRSSLCVARQRLGVAPVRHLFAQVVRPLARLETPGCFYHGLRAVGIDGTVLDVPDSAANAKAFGRPSGGPRGEGAFPQLRKLALVELGTHVELGLVIKHLHCGEQQMVTGLLRHLCADMLLLWDRGFFSYSLWKSLMVRGVKVLARVKNQLILKAIRTLADDSYIAKIYPTPTCRKHDRHGIEVRVIRYKLDDSQRVGHDEEHVLITNLFEAPLHPARELIALYHKRWEQELVNDEQKTHQDPRRASKPAHLRSETPLGVIQEVYALSLAHFVVRCLMFEAAAGTNLAPADLSFTGCLQILQARLPECASQTPHAAEHWYHALLSEMQHERLEPRRNRINPRVIKKAISKWPKKRAKHRHPQRLTKTFMQSVVMLR